MAWGSLPNICVQIDVAAELILSGAEFTEFMFLFLKVFINTQRIAADPLSGGGSTKRKKRDRIRESVYITSKLREIITGNTLNREFWEHQILSQIWYITHRCHKREFLLKFSKGGSCWTGLCQGN